MHRDTNVHPPNVYGGNGQGCGTVWFENVKKARQIIERLGGKIPTGADANLCHLCKCHYSHNTKEWKEAPHEWACKRYKELLGVGEIEQAQALVN